MEKAKRFRESWLILFYNFEILLGFSLVLHFAFMLGLKGYMYV